MTVGDMIKELGRYPRGMEVRLVIANYSNDESREIKPEDVILGDKTIYIYEENAGPER